MILALPLKGSVLEVLNKQTEQHTKNIILMSSVYCLGLHTLTAWLLIRLPKSFCAMSLLSRSASAFFSRLAACGG